MMEMLVDESLSGSVAGAGLTDYQGAQHGGRVRRPVRLLGRGGAAFDMGIIPAIAAGGLHGLELINQLHVAG